MTLVYVVAAWLCGIWLGRLLWSQGVLGCATPGWAPAILAGFFIILALVLQRAAGRRTFAVACGLLALAALGASRYQAHPFTACPDPGRLATFNGADGSGSWVTIEGDIVAYPDVRDSGILYQVRVAKLTMEGVSRPVTGDVLVQAARHPAYGYGDRLEATGRLETPPRFADFDYQSYLAARGIHSLLRQAHVEVLSHGHGDPLRAWLYALRGRAASLINANLPEPAAGLASGILLGLDGSIPAGTAAAFKATGTSHVIVISGSNIALLAGILLGLVGGLIGRRRAALPVIALLGVYVLLVGGDPAAVRAGIMGALYVGAIGLGRQSTAVVSLAAAAGLMTLWNPLLLWDVGFELSALATLGLIQFSPFLRTAWQRFPQGRSLPDGLRRALDWLAEPLLLTLAAQIATLPLMIAYFGQLSPLSLLTNFLILPAQPPILAAGLIMVSAGLAWPPLAHLVAPIPWLLLTYTSRVVELMARLPFASLPVAGMWRWLSGAYYVAFFAGLAWWWLAPVRGWRLPPRRMLARGAGAAALAVPLVLALNLLAARPDGRLHLYFNSAEGCQTSWLVAPDGARIVVATGSAACNAPPGWPVQPEVVIGPGTAAAGQRIDPVRLAPGTGIKLGGGVVCERLAAGDGWALRLRYGSFTTLLPAALDPADQSALLASGADLRATLLAGAAPGTGAWPTLALLDAADPGLVVWPQAATYPPDVAERLAALATLRPPADAIIEVITDGEHLWLQQWSAGPR